MMSKPQHRGEIKHFVLEKGFGFITCPDFDGDVYFQRRNLPPQLQQSGMDLKGHPCIFETMDSQDGKIKAAKVQVLGSVYVGLVKSVFAEKGFGFITSPDVDGDMYFKAKELGDSAWQFEGLKGCEVQFQLVDMPDGKFQAKNIVLLGAPMGGGGQGMPVQGMPQMAPRMAAPRSFAPQPQMAPPQAMIGHTLGDGSQMIGQVKTFDPNKGYGFISAPNFPQDVYFKAMDPALEVQNGMEVTFTLKYTPDGKAQAHNVCRPVQSGEILVGTVRSYNPNKGFGFLAVDGRSQDAYFKKAGLPPELQEEPSLEGAQFQFTVNLNGNKLQAQDLEFLTSSGPSGPPVPSKRAAPGATNTFSTKRYRYDERPQVSNGHGAYVGGTIRAHPSAKGGAPAGPPGLEARHSGSVKSFNPHKGFGFIFCPALQTDVYLNAKQLPEQWRSRPLDGRQVSFKVIYTVDGKAQANDVQVQS
mmetsp:Transcript_41876/g.51549  ORF Transcript_41876/g.51549 Transcript_41876/m.51549 type:complete len:470 (-) Transcript_41876:15-1424(-)